MGKFLHGHLQPDTVAMFRRHGAEALDLIDEETGDATSLLVRLESSLAEVDLVLLGDSFPDRDAHLPVLIACARERIAQIETELKASPLLGREVRSCPKDDPARLRSLASEAVRGRRQRISHRKTVSAAQLHVTTVQPPKPPPERLLEHLLDAGPVGVVLLNEAGVILDLNSRAEGQLDGHRHEVLGTPLAGRFPPAPETDFQMCLRACHEGEAGPVQRVFERIRVDGTSCQLECKFEPVTGRAAAEFTLVLLTDITERERQEASRKAVESRSQAIFEAALDCIITIDHESRILEFNPAAERTFGHQRRNVLGRKLTEVIVPPDLREAHRQGMARYLATGERRVLDRRIEITGMKADGTLIPVELSIVRIRASAPPVFTGFLRDITERKRAEEDLRQSEARFRQLADSIHEVFWLTTPDKDQVLYVSPAYERVWGRSCEGLYASPRDWLDAIHPEDRPAVLKAATHDQARGEYDVEYRIERPDGEIRWIRDRAFPVRDESGQVHRIAGVAEDITDRKQAQEALHQSQTDLHRAQEIGHVGSWSAEAGEDGSLVWSPETFRIFGVKPEAFSGLRREFYERVFAEDLPAVREAVRLAWADESPYRIDHRIVRPDGEVRWVYQQAGFERDSQGRPVRMVGVTQDITERKLAEQQVRHLATFPEVNPNLVLEFAADGSLTYHNEAATKMARSFGLESPAAMLPPNTREIVRECLATGEARSRLEVPLGRRVLSWAFYPILSLGVVHCYVGDITARRELEDQLRQAQKLESVGQLAAGVAHDFNNLLTVIHGNIALMGDLPSVRREAGELLEELLKAAERASGLTRQLLLFSRKEKLQRRALDLNQQSSQLTRMLSRVLGEQIKLEFSYETDLPPVFADPGMIDQAITNLAVNARDAMPRGGLLRLETALCMMSSEAAVRNPEARIGPCVRLSVSDTGTGIPTELLPRIFEPFFTTKEVGKGTGLGLATVYGIVKQHEGWMEVHSTLGQGTTIQIFLPPGAGTAEQRPVRHGVQVPGGSETLLLVEDERALRDLAAKVLTRHGYTVLTAAHGPAALDIWRGQQGSIDLLLTDMVMPEGMSGPELAAAIQEQHPQARVLFTSGYSHDVATPDLVLLEDVNFLPKPYHPSRLLRIVRDCLDRKA
jgi:two-component system, cell cycle sensor histidine kinase and response regulator CckA